MSAHRSFFQTSDFIIYSMIFISLILELFYPTNIEIKRSISILVGFTLLIFSWIIIFTAKYQFKIHQQKSSPNNETTKLIQTGLFAHSRNPIYLGVLFITPALGFLINSMWFVYAIIPSFILIQYILILPEEKYLKNKFGEIYKNYCIIVRRWF